MIKKEIERNQRNKDQICIAIYCKQLFKWLIIKSTLWNNSGYIMVRYECLYNVIFMAEICGGNMNEALVP